MTGLENDLTRQAYREQQPFEPTVMNLGRDGKTPREYLTENGLGLLKVLALGDRDMTALSWYAREGGFDLKAALDELEGYELLDKSQQKRVGLIKRRL